jgi:hypothetical protein
VVQGVRASVRPDEAQRKVKEWQDNFKAYQTALQRLSAAPMLSTAAAPPTATVSTNSTAFSAESAAADSIFVSPKDQAVDSST